MSQSAKVLLFLALAAVGFTSHASAHFKLLKPQSWLNEDGLGGPQKGSPCGPDVDDGQSVPASGAITEVYAGDTITVLVEETIYHPGHYRIALANNREDFTIPPVGDPNSCAYDVASVPTGAHDNVLADGLWKETASSGTNRTLMRDVAIPDAPCEKCTLQVIQVMLNHGQSSCYYYHCADLRILPKASGGGGTAGNPSEAGAASGASGNTGSVAAGSTAAVGGNAGGASAGSSGAAAGNSAAGAAPTAPPTSDTGGACAITPRTGHATHPPVRPLLALLVILTLLRTRRRRAQRTNA